MEQQRKIPEKLYAKADFVPRSYNAEDHTIEVVVATETPVRSWDWDNWEAFNEVLSITPSAIRMERMKAGMPFLEDHRQSVKTTIGRVVDGWIDGNKLRAKIRLTKVEAHKDTIDKIIEGTLPNCSVGYKVHKYEAQPRVDGEKIPTYRAVDWEPHEVSCVAIPADYEAQVRSSESEQFHIVTLKRESNMENQDPKTPPTPPVTPPAPPVNVEAERAAAAASERNRIQTIQDLCRKAQLGDELEQTLIKDGTPLDAARQMILDKWAERSATKTTTSTQPAAGVTGEDGEDKYRSGIETALALRSGRLKEKDFSEKELTLARGHRNKSLLDIAKDSLKRAGYSQSQIDGMDKMTLVGRAITSSTSDLPILLEGTNRRVLLAAYAELSDTWRSFCSVGSVSDFREYKRLRMGTFGKLDSLAENQEYKRKPLTDADFEKVSVGTFGNIINISRQMIINDDLDGMTRYAAMLGRAAARSIEEDVYAFLLSNSGNGGNLVDGNPIFHSSHNNIVSAAAFSADQLEKGRILMAKQKDKDNNAFLTLRPNLLLVGIDLAAQARIYNDAQYDVDVTSKFQVPNKVRGLFSQIIDTPRIEATNKFMYMFASPQVEPTIEVSFLDGVQTPYMESQENWSVDGMEWKVRMDYGVNGVGHRGAVKINIS